MHVITILALPNFMPLDFGIACETFKLIENAGGIPTYEIQVCGLSEYIYTQGFELRVHFGLKALEIADTIIIPGTLNPTNPVPKAVCTALRKANKRGARIASICTGAFVLAASGILNGRRATTHWLFAKTLAQNHPEVSVNPNVLFVDEGSIITSAGASAGLDMCLHLLRNDHGQAAASQASRLAIALLSRDGGQAQYIRHDLPQSSSSLAPLLQWMSENIQSTQDVPSLAAKAGMSPRTFLRRFREQTGTTPVQWILTARVQRAQELLEKHEASIEQISTLSGFDSPVTFRARFRRVVGLTPTEYRRRFAFSQE